MNAKPLLATCLLLLTLSFVPGATAQEYDLAGDHWVCPSQLEPGMPVAGGVVGTIWETSIGSGFDALGSIPATNGCQRTGSLESNIGVAKYAAHLVCEVLIGEDPRCI